MPTKFFVVPTSAPRFFLIRWLHKIGIAALAFSVFSGARLFADQHEWARAALAFFPALWSPHSFHLFAAVLWAGVTTAYIFLHKRKAGVATRSSALQLSIHFMQLSVVATVVSGVALYTVTMSNTVLRVMHAIATSSMLLALLIHIMLQWQSQRARAFTILLPTLRSAILLPSLGFLLLLALFALSLHWYQGLRTLPVQFVNQAPQIDGQDNDLEWQQASTVIVDTFYNLHSDQTIAISVSAVYDDHTLYLKMQWPDADNSVHHLPMQKTENGWQLVHDGYLQADERRYYEDKLAIMISSQRWGALTSVLLNNNTQRGMHQAGVGEVLDLWHWKSVRNFGFGVLDDSAIVAPVMPQPGEWRYSSGYVSDPISAGGFIANWAVPPTPEAGLLRVPRESTTTFSTDTPQSSPLAMTWHDSLPYDKTRDHYPIGTVLPSVVWQFANEGDRADVQAVGHWQNGIWTLEIARPLMSSSSFDLPLQDGSYLWFAAFNHSQIRHSYHLRPLRLVLNKS